LDRPSSGWLTRVLGHTTVTGSLTMEQSIVTMLIFSNDKVELLFKYKSKF